jgi:uncharacterized membrane protein YkoI
MKDQANRLYAILAGVPLCVSLAFTGVATAHAGDDDIEEARAIAKMANLIMPERAIEIAAAEKPGVVTDLDLERKRNRWVYEVEIVDASGIEWEFRIDANDGKILKVKRDWF